MKGSLKASLFFIPDLIIIQKLLFDYEMLPILLLLHQILNKKTNEEKLQI